MPASASTPKVWITEEAEIADEMKADNKRIKPGTNELKAATKDWMSVNLNFKGIALDLCQIAVFHAVIGRSRRT